MQFFLREPTSPAEHAPARDGGASGDRGKPIHGLKRLKATWITYGFASMVLLLSWWMGYLPAWVCLAQIAYHWVGMGTFYVLIRNGRTAHRQDPSLVFEQVLFGISAVVLTYSLSPDARPAAMQLLCLMLVFDMHRLSSAQMRMAASSAVVLIMLSLLLAWWRHPEALNARAELLNLLMAGVQLAALTMISRDVRTMRKRQLQQRVVLQNALEQLHEASQHDALTGLFNRHHMTQLLNHEIKRFARQGRSFSLAIIDIDHFKHINDQFGHTVGDEVLKAFATLSLAHLPPVDALARWGGEEFLLLLPEQGVVDAMSTVDGLRQRIANHDWSQIAPGLSVHFSAGVTDHRLIDEPDHHIVERADTALYQAKAHGRNQVRCCAGVSAP
jgi:diguanylate cyclase (GGDEF)-like protein